MGVMSFAEVCSEAGLALLWRSLRRVPSGMAELALQSRMLFRNLSIDLDQTTMGWERASS